MQKLKTKKDFLSNRVNIDLLSPTIYEGIIKAMDDWANHYHLINSGQYDGDARHVEDAKSVLSYLNECSGKSFSLNNKSAIRLIVAKLNQKYTIEDLKHVIFVKCQKWLGTDYETYLRPETLFGKKFDSYRNESLISPKKNSNQKNYDAVIQATEMGWNNQSTSPKHD